MTKEPLNLARLAQDAAYERLQSGELVLMYEDNQADEIGDEEYQAAAEQLAGPFCGCMTCVVREVISAAWPYLSVLAVEQFQQAMKDPEVRAHLERLTNSIHEATSE